MVVCTRVPRHASAHAGSCTHACQVGTQVVSARVRVDEKCQYGLPSAFGGLPGWGPTGGAAVPRRGPHRQHAAPLLPAAHRPTPTPACADPSACACTTLPHACPASSPRARPRSPVWRQEAVAPVPVPGWAIAACSLCCGCAGVAVRLRWSCIEVVCRCCCGVQRRDGVLWQYAAPGGVGPADSRPCVCHPRPTPSPPLGPGPLPQGLRATPTIWNPGKHRGPPFPWLGLA